MSTNISWILEVSISPEKLDDFRAVAADLVAATKSEAGTLDYEWYLNAEQTACTLFERYADNESTLIHVASFGNFAKRFMAACQPTRFHVFGSPSDAVKAALADMNPIYFEFLDGFSR